MAIFERLGDILKANINDLLDKAENPEKMVKQLIIDMEEQVREATQSLGQAMASEKMAYRQLETARNTSQEWESKAKVALNAGNQDLARKALQSKVEVDKNLAAFEVSYNNIHTQVETLKSNVNALKGKLEEARTRQNMLIARSKMADAQKKVVESFGNTDTNSAFAKLDKMERKIQEKEAQAEAFTEMANSENEVKDQFEDLEKSQAVDAELARLMAQMNPTEPSTNEQ